MWFGPRQTEHKCECSSRHEAAISLHRRPPPVYDVVFCGLALIRLQTNPNRQPHQHHCIIHMRTACMHTHNSHSRGGSKWRMVMKDGGLRVLLATACTLCTPYSGGGLQCIMCCRPDPHHSTHAYAVHYYCHSKQTRVVHQCVLLCVCVRNDYYVIMAIISGRVYRACTLTSSIQLRPAGCVGWSSDRVAS